MSGHALHVGRGAAYCRVMWGDKIGGNRVAGFKIGPTWLCLKPGHGDINVSKFTLALWRGRDVRASELKKQDGPPTICHYRAGAGSMRRLCMDNETIQLNESA